MSIIRAKMGISDNNKLIETFDLTQGRWVSHSPSTSRDVGTQPTLLYRTRGLKAGIDMQDEVTKLVNHGKARKRPVELMLTTPHIDRRVCPRIMSPLVIVPTEAPPKKELEVIELDDSDDDPPSPAAVSLVSIKKEKSASPAPLNRAPLVPQSLFVPSVNIGKSRRLHLAKSTPSFDFTAESDSEVDEDVLGVRASSGHAAWPLKYVKSMAEGFRLMDTMEGELCSHFTTAFRMSFLGSKATFHTHANIWEAATEKQRNLYIKAGFTNEGLWKKFRHDVQNLHGGKVPGKRDRKGETHRKASFKGGKMVQVKVEPQEFERQHDVIVIND
ncbi:hypothetical protein K443DRAFT_13406 [Laccaria amethystina LaAM-08-1]|uniref:Uncharacterized protein n=1 Tax=Laccaria amethystina LaAM-08-1 TaxID=1095629 RepID=A0A0C9WIC3_9AGAR|nr:hypothetical protein K443DRAFT_13406 [Laccaria amethystina LaAM-08-1]